MSEDTVKMSRMGKAEYDRQGEDAVEKRAVRERFVRLIKSKALSFNVLSALGHSPQESVEILL